MWLVVRHPRPHVYRVDVKNAQNSGVPKWLGRITVARISQNHDIATWCRCANDILLVSNVVRRVVDSHYTVLIQSVMFEENGVRVDIA